MKLDERRRLHGLSRDELVNELQQAESALINFRFDAGLNRLTNPAGMHNTRKRIAVLKTLIREKELLNESGFSSVEEYKAYKIAERRTYKAAKAAR
ncbi:MAG TPA: 50S ribosomal protein L29 [Armatimonadota bacterium]|nr:50S ribosomal protein L29 [Armatimonadota bacterium]